MNTENPVISHVMSLVDEYADCLRHEKTKFDLERRDKIIEAMRKLPSVPSEVDEFLSERLAHLRRSQEVLDYRNALVMSKLSHDPSLWRRLLAALRGAQ